jgi:proteasome lid subunit RPN8/RPN11
MVIEVTSSVIEAMQAAARNANPKEACGILLGGDARITSFTQTKNVHPAPQTHFEIDPAALIKAHKTARGGGPQVAGYFHSHPSGDAAPSATDQKSSAKDGLIWAIIGGSDLRMWRDDPSGFEEVSYCISDS